MGLIRLFDKLIYVILIAISGLIIYLLVLNIRTLKKVLKIERKKKKLDLSDAHYHELNNKIQLLIVITSIIVLVVGFLGYNSVNSVIEDTKSEISKELSTYRKQLAASDSSIKIYNQIIKDMIAEKDTILQLSEGLNDLQDDYKLNAKSYFIKNIPVRPEAKDNDDNPDRVYFKNLRTSSGAKLPKFDRDPFLALIGKGEGTVIIEDITKDYFEYYIMTFIEYEVAMGNKQAEPNPKELNSFDLILIDVIDNK